ncbi:hypothetical protein JCM9140_2425 [Halalkalibacter wakoensis JCM 9140]|uniref:Uncharacterized protein n=1 Tax=Halalkalibacter wakoensis JCM 9140 TaxID=1236970 RepID=W4Q338_9BACI|nr:hypothetical protein [Halalkalibacter wakoensis]GAE26370.1 hypothetical protein JCM9140_2425 [Halalkalibacter wakoensis JCM 9140]
MNLYKAHIVHPSTQVPLIVYFNESDGHVTFEKDQELLNVLIELTEGLPSKERFIKNMELASNICQTQYPVSSFKEVYEFLATLGVKKNDLSFQQLFVH